MSNEDQIPAEGSKMDALVKVVLVFFISLLSFSVGTFVGKQVSDSDHRQAALEGGGHGENHAEGDGHEQAAHEEGAAEHSDGEAVHGEEREVASVEEGHGAGVSEEDVNNLTEEFVASEAPADKDGYKAYGKKEHAPTSAHGAPAQGASSHAAPEKNAVHEAPKAKTPHEAPKVLPMPPSKKTAESSPATEKIIKGQSPTSGKVVEEKRQPSNVLPAAATNAVGKYTVQVGAYATEAEAKQHAAMLKNKGWTAFYVPADVSGKTWYRVSVGLFDDSRNAQAFMQQFQKESNTKNALVRKIVQ